MKNKNIQIKIMELLINVEDVNKSVSKTITMDNNYLFEIYKIWKEEEISEIAQNIIKVNLPKDMEKAKQLLLNGFTYNGVEYVALLTTPGLMKEEDSSLEIKCDYYFINKEDEAFKEEMENVASLGKLKNLKGKEICINKDVVSRLGLLMSSGTIIRFNEPLKFAILPEMTYKHIGNYLQFGEKKTDDEEERSIIDLEDLRLEKHKNKEITLTAMDGSGFMSVEIAEEISKKLNKGYDINWCVIRQLGCASKGLLVKFDWKSFYREQHNLDSLIVKDCWNNEVNLFDVDLVLNESVAKWAKNFNSYDDMISAREEFEKYDSLFNSLCITKFNKAQEQIKEYSETSYQLLSNLNLTPKELREIASEDFETYRKAVIDKDIDVIRILLGDWANDEEEAEDKKFLPSTKIHSVLQLDEQMKSIETSQFTINKLLNKKINNFCGGKLHVKGNYKVISQDVFSYFDSLINPDYSYDEKGKLKGINGAINKTGLAPNTNYVPGEYGFRTLARSPLNSATEIIKTELVKNEMYNKYFGDFASDIIFVDWSDTLMRMSGADTDGDIAICIDNQTIYNAVIEDIDEETNKWCFRNQFDGIADKREYTEENLYDCVLETAGNSIGKLSNYGAKISNMIQATPVIGIEGEVTDYDSLFKYYKDNRKEEYAKARQEKDLEKQKEIYINLKNKFEEIMLEHCKNNGFKTEPTEEDYKKFMLDRFQDYKQHSYYLLYTQMCAIDSVKTCVKVDETMLFPLNKLELHKIKKPMYIYYAKYKEENKLVEYDQVQADSSLLNNFAKSVIGEIGYNARNKNKSSNTHLFSVLTKSEEEKGVTVDDELLAYIKKIYKDYTEVAKLIKQPVEALKAEKSKLKNKKEIEAINNKLELEKEIRNNKLNELEVMVYDYISKNLRDKYSGLELLLAVGKARDEAGHKFKSKFIFDFFFEELKEVLIESNHGIMSVYALTEEDNEDNIHVLYKDYKKLSKEVEDINLSKESILKKKCKLGQAIKTRIGGLKNTENLEGIEFEIKYTTYKYKDKDKDKNEIEKDQIQIIVEEIVEDKIQKKMIGYVYNDWAEFIELDKRYRIIGRDSSSSKISATVYLEEVA